MTTLRRRPRWPRATVTCRACEREQLVPIAPWLARRVRDVEAHGIRPHRWLGEAED